MEFRRSMMLDRQGTIANVKELLCDDLPLLGLQSHKVLSWMTIEYGATGDGWLDKIVKTVRALSATSAQMITWRYFDMLTLDEIGQIMNRGERALLLIQNEALLEFADQFTSYYDLHVTIPYYGQKN